MLQFCLKLPAFHIPNGHQLIANAKKLIAVWPEYKGPDRAVMGVNSSLQLSVIGIPKPELPGAVARCQYPTIRCKGHGPDLVLVSLERKQQPFRRDFPDLNSPRIITGGQQFTVLAKRDAFGLFPGNLQFGRQRICTVETPQPDNQITAKGGQQTTVLTQFGINNGLTVSGRCGRKQYLTVYIPKMERTECVAPNQKPSVRAKDHRSHLNILAERGADDATGRVFKQSGGAVGADGRQSISG